MTPELEQHLREMGVVVKQDKQETKKVEYDMTFKDPRDPITGEVPF